MSAADAVATTLVPCDRMTHLHWRTPFRFRIQVAALAADDVQRVLVEQRGAGAQRAVAAASRVVASVMCPPGPRCGLREA